jgi:hypothetical protein
MSLAYGIGGLINVPPPVLSGQGAPPATFRGLLGQSYFDKSTNPFTEYVYNGSGWERGGASAFNEVTANSGTAVPSAGNLNLLGSGTVTTTASGSTVTISATASGYPITPYVVGPIGAAGYQTIQSALDAANTAGGGLVYVQPGSYTENLTLYNNCPIQGAIDFTTIIGVHTPPASGTFTFDSLLLQSATDIFSSLVAGTTALNINNCFIIIANGYVFNLLNWTGELLMDNCGEASTQDGVVNNTGGSAIKFINVEIGAGSSNTMTLTGNGDVRFDTCNINCPINIAGSGTFVFQNGVEIKNSLTIAGSKSGVIVQTDFLTGAATAFTWSSSGTCLLSNSTINTSANPAIAGAGAGTLTIGNIVFINNNDIAATLTLGTTALIQTSSYRTIPLATNVTLSGNTLSATGSNTNIDINVTPKGTGSIIYSASRAAANLNYQATNSDNTSGTSNAGFQAAVGGASAGDPYSQYAVSGITTWTTGIDNSASDAYVIAASATLGTSNAASWSTTGVLTNTAGITATLGAITATNGNLVLGTAGNKILSTSVATTTTAGANSFGSVTLAGGTATVSTTSVTANSLIYIWRQSIGSTGAAALGQLSVGTIVAATSFVINALQAADATALQASDVSVIGWMIVN